MFDISFWEILVILLVALVTLGPQQMLRISYKAGRWVKYFRHSFSAISNEINQQLNVEMANQEKAASSSDETKTEKSSS